MTTETVLTEQQAIERAQAFSRAMVAGDADALEGLLASDFTYTHMSARVEPGSELIQSVRNGRRNQRMDFENMTVRSYSGTTIVNGLNHMIAGTVERPLAFDSHFTAVFVTVEDDWKLAVYHSTRVPEE